MTRSIRAFGKARLLEATCFLQRDHLPLRVPPATDNASSSTAESAAWSDPQLADPHGQVDKPGRVRRMFAAIAPSYDLNNRVHSLWMDQSWRRAAVRAADMQPTDTVLDVACGTGDLTLAFAKRLKQLNGARAGEPDRAGPDDAPTAPPRVLGLDFTYEMLPLARRKAASAPGGDACVWLNGDAMQLPLADASVDVVSIAFGIRNVADPAVAIGEFHRVLRPGGRLVILEFSLPTNRILRGIYNFYFTQVLPRTATLIARDRSGAYRYLPRSVNTFIDREKMVALMSGAGFSDVTVKALTFGIAVVYRGVKRESRTR